MDGGVILKEGFFKNLMSLLRGNPELKKLKTNKKIEAGLKNINKMVSKLEASMQKDLERIDPDILAKHGLTKKQKLPRFTVSDLT